MQQTKTKQMERPKFENSIRHFSHSCPLFQSFFNPQEQSSSCVVCKLKLLNLPSYTCKPCNFHIHQKCFELPQKLRHPFDKNHLLTLIPSPKYQEGRFRCDACGKNGDGFAYHCGDCGIDLHTVCANMPSRVTHQSHPHHQLSLTFSLPSSRSTGPSSFHCNVCCNLGSNTWLYSCRECGEFNAHLLCARRKITGPQHSPNMMQPEFINPAPFNVPSPIYNNPYPNHSLPTNINHMIRPILEEMLNNLVTNTAQDPNQVSQLLQMLGPMGDGGGSGLPLSFGFDSSVFSSVDPSVYGGFDPSLGGDGSGLPLSSGFDSSVFSSVDPSVYGGFDPSLGGGGYDLASSSGFPGFDQSVFSSVDPSVFAGFDPSLGCSGSGLVSSSGFPSYDPSVYSSVDPSMFVGFDPSLGGGGFGLASPADFSGFDPSVFTSVDPSVFTDFDPSLLSNLFSGLSFLSF